MSSIRSSPHIQIGALQRLGLAGANLGRPVKLTMSRRRASRRYDDEVGFDAELYPPGSRPAIAVGDMLVQACASNSGEVFAVRGQAEVTLNVIAEGRGATPWAEAPRHRGLVYIKSSEDSAFTLVQPDGSGVLVVHERGKGIYAYGIRGALGSGEPPLVAAIEVPSWLLRCEPHWLRELIDSKARSSRVFGLAAAIGLYARLGERDDDNATASISLLLAGLPDSDAGRPLLWFSEQKTAWRAAVHNAALTHAHALSDAIDAIARYASSTTETMLQRRWQSASQARDDLECARVLLNSTGQGGLLGEMLEYIDRDACQLRRRGHGTSDEPDPRLLLVARLDPDAWWGAQSSDCEEAWDQPAQV